VEGGREGGREGMMGGGVRKMMSSTSPLLQLCRTPFRIKRGNPRIIIIPVIASMPGPIQVK
jgi:hypothetical protein